MSGVRNMGAGITSIARLRSSIKELPLRIRNAVAEEAAEVLNLEVRDDFAAGRTVYDTARPLSVSGKPLTLVGKTGRTRDALGFVALGTIVRAQLNTPYARYLIGKYGILPQSLPAAWREKLERIVREYREDWARENGGVVT